METQHEANFERGQTSYLYERDATSEKSIVSALLPTSSISQRLYRHWKHPQADHYESLWKTTSAPSTKHYGEMLGQPKKEKSNFIGSSSLDLSSGNYISFLSYRISFPFLKSAPVYFPQFPLPGIFTTIMLLLALVWIAILTIGLVEVGTYLWNRGQIAQLAGESDEMARDNSESRVDELIKAPLQVLVSPRIPRCEVVRHQNENVLLSTNSTRNSESGSEAEESRMP
ncbi:hypothetical protein N7466_010943 [Penicillium verhagenii]|uniref:uncharacterized protein n=1 Tax=Penicillium verhagenii TaxID=1562060 RepID=UPI0025453AB3|nr:uncharacterized protein N7466_010943 [Penicillium verhagenii]KAJ5917389.1 hypothetical protein N7466_010943 [Penicillium verhagenii]